MQDTTVYGLRIKFYSDEVTKDIPCGFMSGLPIDPVPVRFKGDAVLAYYAFPAMYASNPPGELVFTKLPAFMKYNLSTAVTGNGVAVTREL